MCLYVYITYICRWLKAAMRDTNAHATPTISVYVNVTFVCYRVALFRSWKITKRGKKKSEWEKIEEKSK